MLSLSEPSLDADSSEEREDMFASPDTNSNALLGKPKIQKNNQLILILSCLLYETRIGECFSINPTEK